MFSSSCFYLMVTWNKGAIASRSGRVCHWIILLAVTMGLDIAPDANTSGIPRSSASG
jgi:hypothetical protein